MRILIVEDEARIAAFLERGLKEEGWAVDVVHDGNDALDWAAAAEYSVNIISIGASISTSPTTKWAGSRAPSTTCSTGSTPRSSGSASSPPTPRMNSAPRSP